MRSLRDAARPDGGDGRMDFTDRVGVMVARHPRKIVGVFVILFLLSVPALFSLTSFISLNELLPEGDYYDANVILNQELGSDNVMFVFTTPAGAADVTTVEALREVDHMMVRFEEVGYVQTTVSLPGLVKALNFLLTGQFELPPDNPEGNRRTEELFNQALELFGDQLIYDNVLARDHQAGIALIVMDKGHSLQEYRDWQIELKELGLLMDDANPYAGATTNEPISIDVIYANLDNVAITEGPLWVLVALLAAVISAYIVLRRKWLLTLHSLFVLLVAIGITVSAGFLLGVHFNLLTILLVALILAIGIDYAMHVLARYQEEKELGYPADVAIMQATRHVGSALFITMVTTVAGFASLYFSRIQAIGQFGIMVGAGMLTAYLACILLLPALALLRDKRLARRGAQAAPVPAEEADERRLALEVQVRAQQRSSRMGRLAEWNQEHPRVVLALFLLLFVGMAATIAVNGVHVWGASYIEPPILDAETYPMRVLRNIDDTIGIPVEGAILVKGDMTRPASLDYLERIEDEMLGRVPCPESGRDGDDGVPGSPDDPTCYDAGPRDHGILNGMSTVGVVKLLYPTIGLPGSGQADRYDIDSDGDGDQDACPAGGGDPCPDGIPDTAVHLRAFYNRLYDLPTVQGVAYRVVSSNFDYGVVRYNYAAQPVANAFTPEGSLGADIDNYLASAADLRASVAVVQAEYDARGQPYPETYPAAGLLISAIEVNHAIERGNTYSTYVMVATTFLVIYAFWRRIGPTLVTMVPVVVAVGVQYFIIAAMGYEVTYVSIILTGMALGVGIDDAVHFVNRFKEEMAEGRSPRDAAVLANSEVGKVLVATTLTTISPFFVILGSVIAWAQHTAFMTIPTLLAALASTIFLLPVIMRWHAERFPNAWVTRADRRRVAAAGQARG